MKISENSNLKTLKEIKVPFTNNLTKGNENKKRVIKRIVIKKRNEKKEKDKSERPMKGQRREKINK